VVEGVQRLREGAMISEVDETPAMAPGAEKSGGQGVPEVSGADSEAKSRS